MKDTAHPGVGSNLRRFQKLRAMLALLLTLATLYVVPDTRIVLSVLVFFWAILYRPWQLGEIFSFVIAAVFFLFQNYVCLKAGIFEFKSKDILLMPYYEPFLWGFYFTTLKRFVSGSARGVPFQSKSMIGLLVTAVAFSVFSRPPSALLAATIISTLLLLALFHTRLDFYYAGCSLLLGFVIELFGVRTGLWSYPVSDFLGIPWWFATMWISVGLLGYRFLIPLGERLAERVRLHGA